MSRMKEALYGDQPAPFIYNDGPGHRGVSTSVAAAESMRAHVGPIQQRILDYFRVQGTHGCTYAEVMAGCQLGAPTVTARLRELAEARLIKISDKTRNSPSGRACRVYILSEFAA